MITPARRFVVLALFLLLRAAPLAAQAYTLSPAGYQTVLDNAGAIVSNACVWTYRAGTTTPAATYSDALGTVNTNPIRTDSAGRFTAYLVPGVGYSFAYERPCTPPAHGVVLKTADNIVGTPAAPAVDERDVDAECRRHGHVRAARGHVCARGPARLRARPASPWGRSARARRYAIDGRAVHADGRPRRRSWRCSRARPRPSSRLGPTANSRIARAWSSTALPAAGVSRRARMRS